MPSAWSVRPSSVRVAVHADAEPPMVAVSPPMVAVSELRSSSDAIVSVIVSPTLASVVSELSDAIVTVGKVGSVSSILTLDASVVAET